MKQIEDAAGKFSEFDRRSFLQAAAGGAAAGGFFGCGQPNSRAPLPTHESQQRDNGESEMPSNAAMTQQQYPLLRAEGTHRELGRQHGEQAAEQIGRHLDSMSRSMKLSRVELHARALKFQPLFEQHCPHLLDEMRGLADGAKIPLAEAMAVNIRGSLLLVANEGCTTYVIGSKGTADGEILIGQNSDIFAEHTQLGYVLHLKPVDKPEVLMWTFGGMIGYHGINSEGIGHFANDLGDGGPETRFGMPHYPIKRMIHERSRLDEVVDLLNRVPLSVNGNYVLCDGGGEILDVEATADGPNLIRDDGAGFLAHSNHYLCPAYANADNHAQSFADSFPRLDRMNALIREKFGSITVDDLKRFLSDHSSHPTSICRHPQTDDTEQGFETAGQTSASLIAEPAKRRMHVALGNPCTSPFITYSMDS